MASFNQEDLTATFEKDDIEKNKVISAFAVFIPILFFLPMVTVPASRFGKFYANQGLILLLLAVASYVVGLIPILGWLVSLVVNIFIAVCCVLGLINGLNGAAKRAPLVGGFELLK